MKTTSRFRWRLDWTAGDETGIEWFDDVEMAVKRALSLKNDFERKIESDIPRLPENVSVQSTVRYSAPYDEGGGLLVFLKKKGKRAKNGWETIFSAEVSRSRYFEMEVDDGEEKAHHPS